jgi:GNAT superfamily N-acetyltransferase
VSAPALRLLDAGSDADVEKLAALRAATHDREPHDELVTELKGWLRTEGTHRRTWLAEVDDEAVGYVSALLYRRMPSAARPWSGWAYLGNLFVRAEHRGAGTGEALVDAVVDWARDLHLSRVVLSPSQRSVPLYRRMGFREADELLVLPLD